MFSFLTGRAPGRPGDKSTWTTGAKTGIGTALSQHLWFTISAGILNEIYFPRIDQAAIRDMQLIVTDGKKWTAREKTATTCQIDSLAEGVPAYRIVNTCKKNRFMIEKEIVADPSRPTLLQRIRFIPLEGKLSDYRLYVVLAPHLGDGGENNTGWVGEHKGAEGLFASRPDSSLPARDGSALCLLSTAPWQKRSVGYVGRSDGATDLDRRHRMSWQYPKAKNGNIALTGEIDLAACEGEFTLVLAFGQGDNEAGTHARASLWRGFDDARDVFCAQWQAWQSPLLPLDRPRAGDGKNMYRVSTRVIRAHESTNFPGGMIASLSLPWGFARGTQDKGGYHVAWPRDLAMAAGGYLASGAMDDALRVLAYLESVQEEDGHWQQCIWLDGRPYFDKIQLDETALPILLVDLALRKGNLKDVARHWRMVAQGARYLLKHGPASPQDRWESVAGYTPFTIASCIAALLAAADMADAMSEGKFARTLRDAADQWFAGIDRWNYVTGNEWCERHGVEGYYNRITPGKAKSVNMHPRPVIEIKNRPKKKARHRADLIVSPDALALVRFGLRTPGDVRIQNTIKVIDEIRKADLPMGTGWRRYNEDGYGEHDDGRPFDGTGHGRVWPLLVGERAHVDLMAGDIQTAMRRRDDMERFANAGGMIPEQVWNGPTDIPEHDLFSGQATGSGCPLVWAHAEYVKLLRSLRDGEVFDLPPQTVKRYLGR